jgi:hypothetical protein
VPIAIRPRTRRDVKRRPSTGASNERRTTKRASKKGTFPEPIGSSPPTMEHVTIILNDRDSLIELLHHDSDPGLWIVRRWKKNLWFKKRLSSDWFNDKNQAMDFAQQMKIGPPSRLKIMDPTKL